MSDELIVVTEELKSKLRSAGSKKLDQAQLAIYLGLSDQDCRMLMFKHPELNREYRQGETKMAMQALDCIVDTMQDPESKQRFAAAKYIYELFSGRNSGPSTVVVNQTVNNGLHEKNMKLLDILGSDIVEAIVDDANG